MIPMNEKIKLEEYTRLVDDLTVLVKGFGSATDEAHYDVARIRVKEHAAKVYMQREVEKLQKRLAELENA